MQCAPLSLAKVPRKVAHWHFPLAPGRWRIDPLLHGSADKDNCAAAELNAMYHGQSNTHMATHLRLMPFPMANCTVEVSTASATQSPLANAQHKHANKTHVQRNWGEGSTSNDKHKTHANANTNGNVQWQTFSPEPMSDPPIMHKPNGLQPCCLYMPMPSQRLMGYH